jgi:hypothetical protein
LDLVLEKDGHLDSSILKKRAQRLFQEEEVAERKRAWMGEEGEEDEWKGGAEGRGKGRGRGRDGG